MTAFRTTRTGFYGGIVFGFAQDLISLARGRRPRYIDLFGEALGLSTS